MQQDQTTGYSSGSSTWWGEEEDEDEGESWGGEDARAWIEDLETVIGTPPVKKRGGLPGQRAASQSQGSASQSQSQTPGPFDDLFGDLLVDEDWVQSTETVRKPGLKPRRKL